MIRGDTIAALATAPGRAAVAIIRVSGAEALSLGERLAGAKLRLGAINFRRLEFRGELLDEAIVLAFKGPRSYTGEDTVEFQCHGGTITAKRVLEACFALGARLARRGEFTERAFLNGRLALTEAEGVIDLIDAKTVRSAKDALLSLGGAKKAAYDSLYTHALALSTELEHALDVSEAELPIDFYRVQQARSAALVAELDKLLSRFDEGRILREGALVVLAGAPNAGKSSLLNALLGVDRAIVSAIPGTTRDSISEWVDFSGWPVRLTDTAGLRDTSDGIEAEGVGRSEALMAEAEVVVWLSERAEAVPSAVAAKVRGELIHVFTKVDLDRARLGAAASVGALAVSSVTGEGLEALRGEIAAALSRRALVHESESVATPSERERARLEEARSAFTVSADDPVLMANAFREGCFALARLVGAEYSEDLLSSLFSRFCVGK